MKTRKNFKKGGLFYHYSTIDVIKKIRDLLQLIMKEDSTKYIEIHEIKSAIELADRAISRMSRFSKYLKKDINKLENRKNLFQLIDIVNVLVIQCNNDNPFHYNEYNIDFNIEHFKKSLMDDKNYYKYLEKLMYILNKLKKTFKECKIGYDPDHDYETYPNFDEEPAEEPYSPNSVDREEEERVRQEIEKRKYNTEIVPVVHNKFEPRPDIVEVGGTTKRTKRKHKRRRTKHRRTRK